ncbi:MAG: peptidase family protein, partial [Nocardioidaceae bacterium]|nr:peptidase family protein [Nocardioidaceae bacterium]
MNHAARRDALASSLRQHEYDFGLVTALVNVRYLTGFTGSNGALKVAADGTATLVTDGRYKDQAIAEAPDVERVIARDLLEALCAGASGRVAIESHTVSVDDHTRIEKLLPGADLCSL